jgi:AcrR family transcriptional regulator
VNEEISESPKGQGLDARLISVAMDLLVKPRDVKLPSMREIAAAAGVAPGAAYRHFDSQDDLFFAVISHLFTDLQSHLLDAAKDSKGLRQTARSVAHAYVSWGLNNPGGYQLIFEVTDDEELLKSGKRPGLSMLEEIEQMISPRLRLPKKGAARVTALWIALHGLVSLRIHKTGMPWQTSIEQDVDTLLKALLRP